MLLARLQRRAGRGRKLPLMLALGLAVGVSALISRLERVETPLDIDRPLPASSNPSGRENAIAQDLRPALHPEDDEVQVAGDGKNPARRRIDFLPDRPEPNGSPVRERFGRRPASEPDATVASAARAGQELATRRAAEEQSRSRWEQDPALTHYPAGILPDTVGGAYMLAALAGASLLGVFGVSSLFRERRANRRQTQRRRISQPGCIRTELLPAPLDCTILDISLGGARLGLAQDCRLPPEFTLVFQQTGIEHRVQVRWRNEGQLGVQFLT